MKDGVALVAERIWTIPMAWALPTTWCTTSSGHPTFATSSWRFFDQFSSFVCSFAGIF